jgi:hypothetical protein
LHLANRLKLWANRQKPLFRLGKICNEHHEQSELYSNLNFHNFRFFQKIFLHHTL